MKDLASITKQDVQTLIDLNILDGWSDDRIFFPCPYSDNKELYMISFNTSEEQTFAYNVIFNHRKTCEDFDQNEKCRQEIEEEKGIKIEIGSISLCEEMVVSTIWDSSEDPDLAATMAATNKKFKKNWKPQTVSTFLARLIRKNFITSYRKGRYSYYQPAVSKEEYIRCQLRHLADTFENGDLNEIGKQLAFLLKEDAENVRDAK